LFARNFGVYVAMSTILVTYELGAGLGHLNRLVAVSQRLQGDHIWVFALPDRALGEPIVKRAFGDKAHVLEGVCWPVPNDPNIRKIPTHTFADVIAIIGFNDGDRLSAKTTHWRTILQDVVPNLIIADFAPTLRLAIGGKLPFVVVGNGYTVPPRGQLLPPIRHWETSVSALSRANEARLLAAVNVVRAQLRGEAIDFFSDLFSGEHTFVCTLPEFDPYRRFRCGPTLWPFNIPDVALGPPSVQRAGPPIFVYLPANHPALWAVISALNDLKIPSGIYVAGMTAQELAKRCSPTVRVHAKPADLAHVLPNTWLLIHHGGLGTAYAGLLAAVPQLVLPFNLEHSITAAGLEHFGVAKIRTARAAAVATDMRDLISSLLQDGQLQQAAIKAAQNLGVRRVADPISEVVQACQQHL
jgi:UDP:flavonoid glycosyltransferase YjiC (YdhE family)